MLVKGSFPVVAVLLFLPIHAALHHSNIDVHILAWEITVYCSMHEYYRHSDNCSNNMNT